MLSSVILPVLLVVANILGVAMIIPQVVRLGRHRVTDGVSGAWIGVGVAMNLWWSAYGIQGESWGIVPVSIGGALLYAIMAGRYVGIVGVRSVRSLLTGGLVVALVPLLLLVASGWSAAGLAIGLAYAVQFTPAALHAVRSQHVAGISPATWIMAWIEAVVWFVYGCAIGDAALVIGGGGGTVMATIILDQLWRSRSVAGPTGRESRSHELPTECAVLERSRAAP